MIIISNNANELYYLLQPMIPLDSSYGASVLVCSGNNSAILRTPGGLSPDVRGESIDVRSCVESRVDAIGGTLFMLNTSFIEGTALIGDAALSCRRNDSRFAGGTSSAASAADG